MRTALFILLCLGLVSCDPSKKLTRLLAKHPELRDTVHILDTVWAKVEYIRHDSVFRYEYGDTLVLWKDRLRVKTVVQSDTVWQQAESLPDSVPAIAEYDVPVIQPTREVEKMPWWVPWALGLSGLTALIAVLRK